MRIIMYKIISKNSWLTICVNSQFLKNISPNLLGPGNFPQNNEKWYDRQTERLTDKLIGVGLGDLQFLQVKTYLFACWRVYSILYTFVPSMIRAEGPPCQIMPQLDRLWLTVPTPVPGHRDHPPITPDIYQSPVEGFSWRGPLTASHEGQSHHCRWHRQTKN